MPTMGICQVWDILQIHDTCGGCRRVRHQESISKRGEIVGAGNTSHKCVDAQTVIVSSCIGSVGVRNDERSFMSDIFAMQRANGRLVCA